MCHLEARQKTQWCGRGGCHWLAPWRTSPRLSALARWASCFSVYEPVSLPLPFRCAGEKRTLSFPAARRPFPEVTYMR